MKKLTPESFTHVIVARCEHGHMVGVSAITSPDNRPKDTAKFVAEFLSRGRTIARITKAEYRKSMDDGEKFGCPSCSYGKAMPLAESPA